MKYWRVDIGMECVFVETEFEFDAVETAKEWVPIWAEECSRDQLVAKYANSGISVITEEGDEMTVKALAESFKEAERIEAERIEAERYAEFGPRPTAEDGQLSILDM